MSINTIDKNADDVEVLVDNTNEVIVSVNNQLDASVLANLTTVNKDTLVNAINEINAKKLDVNTTQINNDLSIEGKLSSDSIAVRVNDDGNSVVEFYDTTSTNFIKLLWNNHVNKWQLSFPDGRIVDIANSDNIDNLQYQIDNIADILDYNFNTNGKTLILKQLSATEINNYIGPKGELVINSDDWTEMRIQDGETKGGVIISGSLVIDWSPNTLVRKNQCVIYEEGLYRSKIKHVTSDVFEIEYYDILAAYRKFIEHQIIEEDTDRITLAQAVEVKDNIIINVGGLLMQDTKYNIVDRYHLEFDEIIPKGTSIEITHIRNTTLINSSIIIDTYVAKQDGENVINLSNEVLNRILINQVNVENSSLLTSEWILNEGNKSITLKNGLNRGDRVQVTYWRGVNIAQDGITFTPSINNNILSWVNNGGLENPEPIEITDAQLKNSTVVTNRLIEIPQDIELGLNNGKLTLKSGSRVYIPNGDNYVNRLVSNDIQLESTAANGRYIMLFGINDSGNDGVSYLVKNGIDLFSGDDHPSNTPTTAYWYDTLNNIIKQTTDNGVNWDVIPNIDLCLPLCMVTVADNNIVSVEQVFNGIGCIGSDIYALPGVVGSIPNGRKENSSLNNIIFSINTVLRAHLTSTGIFKIRLSDSFIGASKFIYSEIVNKNYVDFIATPNVRLEMLAGDITCDNGYISNIRIKLPLHLADYSEVIHNTGNEDIDGWKNFVDHINKKDTKTVYNEIPTGNDVINAIYFTDKNDEVYGACETVKYSSGTNAIRFSIRGNDGNWSPTSLSLGKRQDGSEYATAPTVSADSNSIEIATTAWCKTIGNGLVHTTGNETIAGVKTFSEVIQGTAYRAFWGDLAEYYNSDREYPKGTLVQFGGDEEITIATNEVNAVITSNPALIMNSELKDRGQAIALCGRVPVRVIGKVHKFDQLTLSNIPGVAKVADNEKYNIIARALESKEYDEEGLVNCVVKFTL